VPFLWSASLLFDLVFVNWSFIFSS
jgi:hypothetical protein